MRNIGASCRDVALTRVGPPALRSHILNALRCLVLKRRLRIIKRGLRLHRPSVDACDPHWRRHHRQGYQFSQTDAVGQKRMAGKAEARLLESALREFSIFVMSATKASLKGYGKPRNFRYDTPYPVPRFPMTI